MQILFFQSTLQTTIFEPRMAQLETLEAKVSTLQVLNACELLEVT